MMRIPIATVAISSSTAAVLLVTPVMPKPLSSRYGKSLPAANHLAYHVGNSCGIGRRPGMVVLAAPGSASGQNQAGTGRREELGPVFCTNQPPKKTPQNL